MHDEFNRVRFNVIDDDFQLIFIAFFKVVLEETRLCVVLYKINQAVIFYQLIQVDLFVVMRTVHRTVSRVS